MVDFDDAIQVRPPHRDEPPTVESAPPKGRHLRPQPERAFESQPPQRDTDHDEFDVAVVPRHIRDDTETTSPNPTVVIPNGLTFREDDIDHPGEFDEAVSARPAEEVNAAHRAGGKGETRPWTVRVRETGLIIVMSLLVTCVLRAVLIQTFYIPSGSMEDTLNIGDRVLVSRLVPRVLDVHRGDIVVFRDTDGWMGAGVEENPGIVARTLNLIGWPTADSDSFLIKRAIGLPGDRVACEGPSHPVTVNGVPINEHYLSPGSIPSERMFDVIVPDGMLFVLGDNRQNSADSRYHLENHNRGFVDLSDVVGTALATIWPVNHLTAHLNPDPVFKTVPEP